MNFTNTQRVFQRIFSVMFSVTLLTKCPCGQINGSGDCKPGLPAGDNATQFVKTISSTEDPHCFETAVPFR